MERDGLKLLHAVKELYESTGNNTLRRLVGERVMEDLAAEVVENKQNFPLRFVSDFLTCSEERFKRAPPRSLEQIDWDVCLCLDNELYRVA